MRVTSQSEFIRHAARLFAHYDGERSSVEELLRTYKFRGIIIPYLISSNHHARMNEDIIITS